MNVWAIVPVKPLARAKSRLAEALIPEDRATLAARLLRRTVRLLVEEPTVQGVLVISRDPQALAMVRELDAQTVQESGTPELNNALQRATQVLWMKGASAALVVPADLPLLEHEDIREVVDLGRYLNSVVVAPDRHEGGTNLMLMRPPGVIQYAYGEGSFLRHQRLARKAGADVLIYRSERVALDLDTPDDLRVYLELAQRLDVPIIEPLASDEITFAGDACFGYDL